MISTFSSKQQRHLAIAILATALLAIFSATVLPIWFANSARQADITLLQQRLYRLQYMADEGVSLRPRLEQMKREKINNGHYLKGNTETVAAAELQRLVKTITNRNHSDGSSKRIRMRWSDSRPSAPWIPLLKDANGRPSCSLMMGSMTWGSIPWPVKLEPT